MVLTKKVMYLIIYNLEFQPPNPSTADKEELGVPVVPFPVTATAQHNSHPEDDCRS